MNTAASAYSKKRKSPYVINNIRVTPKSIKIGYEYLKGGRAESYTLDSAEKPRPELYDAMKNLASHVASLLEIENLNLNHRIKPTLVKYAYDNNGMMSAVIESNFSIPLAGAHVVIRTPSKQEPFGWRKIRTKRNTSSPIQLMHCARCRMKRNCTSKESVPRAVSSMA